MTQHYDLRQMILWSFFKESSQLSLSQNYMIGIDTALNQIKPNPNQTRCVQISAGRSFAIESGTHERFWAIGLQSTHPCQHINFAYGPTFREY